MTGIKTVIPGEALHRFISRKCKSDIPLEDIFRYFQITSQNTLKSNKQVLKNSKFSKSSKNSQDPKS